MLNIERAKITAYLQGQDNYVVEPKRLGFIAAIGYDHSSGIAAKPPNWGHVV